jgi:hypothetical protein
MKKIPSHAEIAMGESVCENWHEITKYSYKELGDRWKKAER